MNNEHEVLTLNKHDAMWAICSTLHRKHTRSGGCQSLALTEKNANVLLRTLDTWCACSVQPATAHAMLVSSIPTTTPAYHHTCQTPSKQATPNVKHNGKPNTSKSSHAAQLGQVLSLSEQGWRPTTATACKQPRPAAPFKYWRCRMWLAASLLHALLRRTWGTETEQTLNLC